MRVQNSIPKFIHINELDSTNNYVANVVRHGEIHSGTVVSADFQREGRGQRATKWQSLIAQNALFSIFLSWEKLNATDQFQLSMLTAIAIVEILEELGIQNIKIKWPNDIFVENRKIGGILIENDLNGQQISSSIVGIGLNVNQVHFESNMQATSIKLETGQPFDIQSVIKKVTFQVLTKLKEVAEIDNPFYTLKKVYLDKLMALQKTVQVFDTTQQEKTTIKPIDISQSGQLLALDHHGKLRSFDIKDIVWMWDEN